MYTFKRVFMCRACMYVHTMLNVHTHIHIMLNSVVYTYSYKCSQLFFFIIINECIETL